MIPGPTRRRLSRVIVLAAAWLGMTAIWAQAGTLVFYPTNPGNDVTPYQSIPTPGPDLEAGRIGSSSVGAVLGFCREISLGQPAPPCRRNIIHAFLALTPRTTSSTGFDVTGAPEDLRFDAPAPTVSSAHQPGYQCCHRLLVDVTGWDPWVGFRVQSSVSPPLRFASATSDPGHGPALILTKCTPRGPVSAARCLRLAHLRVHPLFPTHAPRVMFTGNQGSITIGPEGTYTLGFVPRRWTNASTGLFVSRLPYAAARTYSYAAPGNGPYRFGRWRVYVDCGQYFALWHAQGYTYVLQGEGRRTDQGVRA
jgi:hypothetical protein